MKKILASAIAGICAINLIACSQGGGGSSQGGTPPAPVTTQADQLKVLIAGQVPLLNGGAATIDAIVYNTSSVAVTNAKFSLNGINNAKITSYNGCDKIIAPNSECRVSLQFNAMKDTQTTLSQPLTVRYTNTYGQSKVTSMLYNAVRISQTGTTPKLVNTSMPTVLTDIGNGNVRGVAYVLVQNPSQVPYSLKNTSFSSSAFKISTINYPIGVQLNNGTLVEVEYEASKSTALSRSDAQVGKNGGFSKLSLGDSLGSSLTLNTTSDYISGGYLLSSILNPIDSTSSQSETLILTNVGTSDVSSISVTDSLGIITFNNVPVTVTSGDTKTVTVTPVPGSEGSPNVLISSSTNSISVPITIYSSPKPLVVLQNLSYLFAAQTAGQTKAVTLKNMSNQSIHVDNVTFTKDAGSSATVTPSGDGCTGQNISAGGTCTISSVNISSDVDETLSSIVVNLAYTYNGGGSQSPLSAIGRIPYQSVLRQSVSIAAPSSFEVVGNNLAVNSESVVITNTSTLHSVTVESWVLSNNNSSSSWLKINSNGNCGVGTELLPESANNCTFGISLGPVKLNNPSDNINSTESLSVTFITKPLTTDALVATGLVPFQVTIGNQAYLTLDSYTPANSASGAGTVANPYNFLGSAPGSSKTMALKFVNTSGAPLTINNVQHLANPFFWAQANNTCTGTLNQNESCVISYYDSLYQNIANTTQASPNVVNNLVLPEFIVTSQSTNWTFKVPAINPNTNDNTVYSSEGILLLDHIPAQNSDKVNIITQATVGTSDSLSNYSFTESANIAANNLIQNTGYSMYNGSNCSVNIDAFGMIVQQCTYNSAINPYGVTYISTTGGQAGTSVNLNAAYYITPTGNQQAISQKQNYTSVGVN